MANDSAQSKQPIVNWLSEEEAAPVRKHLRRYGRKADRSDFYWSNGAFLGISGILLIFSAVIIARGLLPQHSADILPTWLKSNGAILRFSIAGILALGWGIWWMVVGYRQQSFIQAELPDLVQGYEGIITGKASEPYGDYVLLQRQSLLSYTGIPHLRLRSLKHFKQVWPRELDEEHLALIRAEIP